MAEVVHESGGSTHRMSSASTRCGWCPEVARRAPGEVAHADGVFEARVRRRGVHVEGPSQLFEPRKALELGGR